MEAFAASYVTKTMKRQVFTFYVWRAISVKHFQARCLQFYMHINRAAKTWHHSLDIIDKTISRRCTFPVYVEEDYDEVNS
jgi:hypothetical protein